MQGTKKTLLLIFGSVLGTIIFLGLGAFGFWFFENRLLPPKKSSPNSSQNQIIHKSQKSQLTLTPVPSLTQAPVASSTPEFEPEESPVSDNYLLRQAFATKYSKDISEVNIEIQQQEGKFAKGGVSFAGEMGGGMWLAYKKNGVWHIVYDGQGTIPCDAVNQPYSFPVSMVSECWDEASQTLIQR